MPVCTIFGSISTSPESFIIALSVLLVTILYYALKNRGLPPGPIGLPYLGYWPFMNNDNCHLKLVEQKRKHGDVFSFRCTGRLYINLGSIKAIREAHITKSECFGARISDFSVMSYILKDGVAFINGEPWRVLRKFFVQTIKERGVLAMKNSASSSLYDSINSTIEDLKEKKGEPVNMIELLTYKCSTVLRVTLFGDVGSSDEQILKLNKLFSTLIACLGAANTLLAGNIARYLILPFSPEYRASQKALKKMEEILYGIIKEHERTYDEEHIRDMIDEYFKERDKRRRKGDPTAEYFTDAYLMGSLLQIVGDGVVSVASLISILLKILLTHDGEEEKIFKDIVEVVGLERLPTIEDKSKLNYVNAFILEALRMSDLFPFFPSLECTKETTLNGYRIPKGAITLINFSCAHYDPEVFEEPEKFNPSRYIQVEGKQRPELPIAFGVGKRACLGEGFTMMQVFLFLTSLVQNFHLTLPKEESTSSSHEQFMDGTLRISARPRN